MLIRYEKRARQGGKSEEHQSLSDSVQVSGCFNKQKFKTAGEAKRVVRALEKRHRRPVHHARKAVGLCVYRCQYCGYHHIGRRGEKG